MTSYMVVASMIGLHLLRPLAVRKELHAQKIIKKWIVAKMASVLKKVMMVKTAARKKAAWIVVKMENAVCPAMTVKIAARNPNINFKCV
jgi:hypothetical protein